MRVIELTGLAASPINRFDSRGFSIGPLGVLDATHVMVARLEPDGVIGRHPAVGAQVLLVLSGTASASGEDRVAQAVSVGQAVVWSDGEQHETRSRDGLLALIIEGQWGQGPGGAH